MPLRIDRVDTEIEILRKESADAGASDAAPVPGGVSGTELLGERQARAELRERLRPIVMEILNDELSRIKRKVGSP